jgi:hypothetical protein
VFSTAIRRSSAESLGLQKIEMTKFAQMSELTPFAIFSRNPVLLPIGALQCTLRGKGYALRVAGGEHKKIYRNTTPAQHGTTASQRFTYTTDAKRTRADRAAPAGITAVFTGCHLLVTVLFTRPAARCERKASAPVLPKSTRPRLLPANATPVPHAGLRPQTIASAPLYVPL